jgi:hypothetical protein
MLNGQRIAYNSERAINVRDIGTGENALLCVTDRPSCCSGSGRAGEWHYPDGRRVNIQGADEDFYRNRGNRVVRLNRARNVLAPTGRYRCQVPDVTGTTQNIYISITGEAHYTTNGFVPRLSFYEDQLAMLCCMVTVGINFVCTILIRLCFLSPKRRS